MSYYVANSPGVQAARTATPRIVFKGGMTDWLPGGKLISGTYSRDPGNTGDVGSLRAGLIMGKRTSGGLFAPSILGVTTNAEAVGSTSIEVAAGVVTELVRRVGASGTFKLTGAAVAGGTVITETVTYSAASSTTITVTAIANNFLAGSFIQPTDGSEIPLTFLPDGFPIRVLDQDAASISEVDFPLIPTGGHVTSSQLITWPSEVSLRAWLVSWLNAPASGKFTFDHAYNA